MMLHDIVTIGLTVLSYTSNYIGLGISVLFFHDFSDIPVSLSKAFSETKLKLIAVPSFLTTIVTWAYFRIYWFPKLFLAFFVYHPETPYQIIHATFILCCILTLLHVYWFSLFLQILYALLFKGKTEDTITNKQEPGRKVQ